MRVAGAATVLVALVAGCDPSARPDSPLDAVVDDMGVAHAPGPPRQRVVSLIPSVTATLVGMGAADRLIARTQYDEQPELATLPVVAGALEPSVEVLVDLDPDLLIMWPTGGDGGPIGRRLKRVGLDWYAAAVNTVPDFERHATQLGALLGLGERPDSLVAAVRGEMARARDSWSGRRPVEIFYVVQREPPMTVGRGTFLDSVFVAAGAVNSFRDVEGQWPLISIEQIVWRNPQFVVVPVVGYGTPRVAPGARDPAAAGLAGSVAWGTIPAVAEGRVISVDASLFGVPGPRMGEAARYLAHRIHGVGEPTPPSALRGALPARSPTALAARADSSKGR